MLKKKINIVPIEGTHFAMVKKSTPKKEVTIPEILKHLCKPIGEAKLWKDNPRKNDGAAEKLAELILQNGFRVPIVVDQDGVIRAGNTRYKAAKLLGMTEIPMIFQKFTNENAATAFALSDNKASEYSEWDEDVLRKLLLNSEEGTGFTAEEKRFIFTDPDIAKVEKINASLSPLKDKIVVMICDQTAREDIIELLKTWIKTTGLKNIEVRE